ncbi:MAG: aconitate hydratase AcnA [Elusimicrobia bacterium]|nr:aconitate hydratase AcnA [Elusimicrobiota bacterium]MDE2425274.1 aconitate hydratase AcnA [Elusimicrobiota bacterium]
MTKSLDSFKTRESLKAAGKTYEIFSLKKAASACGRELSRLPFSMRVFLENLLRHEDGRGVARADIEAVAAFDGKAKSEREVFFTPARVLMQDFTGVPAVVDLAAMREAIAAMGGEPKRINPLVPVDLVIDHSVQVDVYGSLNAFAENSRLEFSRNKERYAFLKWGQKAFRNFRAVPPETGIVHQVNLEYLARVVWTSGEGGSLLAYPDTLVGTDSHTTMINGLGVVGWGVGGIEAEAAMLGQPLSMLIPEVVGFKLIGRLPEGATATDAVLTATQMLRRKGVVGKFVEFHGPGLSSLSLADRATLANMAPEYGATMGFFPVDERTLEYLRLTGRPEAELELIEAYCKEQGLFRGDDDPQPAFSDELSLDLGSVKPSLAGPKRPQDRIELSQAKKSWEAGLPALLSEKDKSGRQPAPAGTKVAVELGGRKESLGHGSVVIAAITSCTNTSNPAVLIGAGLLAKKAAARGLRARPWVKTSLAPGSKTVMDYLEAAGLKRPLEQLGFHLVGYGCTTCIGNSGPLPIPVAQAVSGENLVVAAVLSGNRNFEGRINPLVKANYLASPPLVVAYALAGRMDVDLLTEPLGAGSDGKPVYLKDIWPSNKEVAQAVAASVKREMFLRQYGDVFAGDENWRSLKTAASDLYAWDQGSTYVRLPPYFEELSSLPRRLSDIRGARALAVFGDSVTTDHISPAGSIAQDSPAGLYLRQHGVSSADFNSYGSRRGNHEVMMRGTFANIRIKNLMLDGAAGCYTLHLPDKSRTTIFEASQLYRKEGVPLVVVAGKEYGSGSSRDWAAKGPMLLGVQAVIAESFERIHRSNLVGMGLLPLQFLPGQSARGLGLSGLETYEISGLSKDFKPRKELAVRAVGPEGKVVEFKALSRIDTSVELDYYRYGGILSYVLLQMLSGRDQPARA